jgi:hypothetical protein
MKKTSILFILLASTLFNKQVSTKAIVLPYLITKNPMVRFSVLQ